ncbi:MAG: hypothetical protein ACI4TA_04750 [Acetatifactor sp.]
MSKLSPNAEKLADIMYESYQRPDGSKEFSDFSGLGMDESQLRECFDELEKFGLAISEEYDDGQPYLYILYGLIQYKDTGKLPKII